MGWGCYLSKSGWKALAHPWIDHGRAPIILYHPCYTFKHVLFLMCALYVPGSVLDTPGNKFIICSIKDYLLVEKAARVIEKPETNCLRKQDIKYFI